MFCVIWLMSKEIRVFYSKINPILLSDRTLNSHFRSKSQIIYLTISRDK